MGPAWHCVWANDIDPKKEAVYVANFGSRHFVRKDIADVTAAELDKRAALAWASFPCQDLSLAGWRRGLSAQRSGTFWPFWRIMHELRERGSRPPIIVIENVTGLLYGDSFLGLCEALAGLDMQFGALVMDAKRFVPQSRPRVFFVCVDSRVDCSPFRSSEPIDAWTPKALRSTHALLNNGLEQLWRWWSLPVPSAKPTSLARIIEMNPVGVRWHTPAETKYLLSLMNENNLAKVENARRRRPGRHIGFVYKRIREGVQRAEVRFDGIAGCLRTPKGGSSRQTVVIVSNGTVRSRLLSPREAAGLMGADEFKLPEKYNEAYKAMGDGVVVPVVRWLSNELLTPLAAYIEASLKNTPVRDSLHPAVHDFRRSSERRAAEWLRSMPSKGVSSPS